MMAFPLPPYHDYSAKLSYPDISSRKETIKCDVLHVLSFVVTDAICEFRASIR